MAPSASASDDVEVSVGVDVRGPQPRRCGGQCARGELAFSGDVAERAIGELTQELQPPGSVDDQVGHEVVVEIGGYERRIAGRPWVAPRDVLDHSVSTRVRSTSGLHCRRTSRPLVPCRRAT